MFTLKLKTDNAAFNEYAGAGYEVARILRAVANKLEEDADRGACLDSNGNRVGEWKLTN